MRFSAVVDVTLLIIILGHCRKTGVILNCDETDEEGTLEFTDSKPNKAASVTAYVLLSFPLSIVICVFVFVTLSNESVSDILPLTC